MRELAVVRTENFHLFAYNNGLKLIDVPDDTRFSLRLPAVKLVHGGDISWIDSIRLRNMGRVVVHIPEAIVRGRRLATIWGNALLPTGYAHSFNWVEEGGFVSIADGGRCAWPTTNVIDLGDDDEKFLLGTMAHFGHFFTDCLDRLLAFQQAGFQQKSNGLIKDRRGQVATLRFLTIIEIANHLGVTARTVRRWIESGALVAHRLEGVVRVSEADFAAFLAIRRKV